LITDLVHVNVPHPSPEDNEVVVIDEEADDSIGMIYKY
jgi:hypothetical protein